MKSDHLYLPFSSPLPLKFTSTHLNSILKYIFQVRWNILIYFFLVLMLHVHGHRIAHWWIWILSAFTAWKMKMIFTLALQLTIVNMFSVKCGICKSSTSGMMGFWLLDFIKILYLLVTSTSVFSGVWWPCHLKNIVFIAFLPPSVYPSSWTFLLPLP